MKRISFESNKFPSQILTNVCTIPLYEQFKQQIPEFRLLGTLTHGSVIPSENGLLRQFRVSVERSLRLLVVTSGTTYYWKVIASDPKGSSAESETWSFAVE